MKLRMINTPKILYQNHLIMIRVLMLKKN